MGNEYSQFHVSVSGQCLRFVVGRRGQYWGVEAQSYYWLYAGYTRLNEPDVQFDRLRREGLMTELPRTMWGQMLLLGASVGATVYSIEPTRNVIWTDDAPPHLADPLKAVIAPFFSMLSRVGVPSRELVKDKIQVAYHADFTDEYAAQRSDVDYFRGRSTNSWRDGRQLYGAVRARERGGNAAMAFVTIAT